VRSVCGIVAGFGMSRRHGPDANAPEYGEED